MTDDDAAGPSYSDSGMKSRSDERRGRRKKDPSTAAKKRRKRQVVKVEEEEGAVDLGFDVSEIADDIIDPLASSTKVVSKGGTDSATVTTTGQFDEKPINFVTVPNISSETGNKVFVEKKRTFTGISKAKLEAQSLALSEAAAAGPLDYQYESLTTIQLALVSQRIFRTIAIFLHGLFAGFALCHTIVTYILSDETYGYADFVRHYMIFAWPVQSLYYFLFAWSTVACFDRYDIARPNRAFFQKAYRLRSGGLSIAVYIIGLILSLSISGIDDRIRLQLLDDALWRDPKEQESTLYMWRVINLLRALCAILGWVIISTRPGTDKLAKNLRQMDDVESVNHFSGGGPLPPPDGATAATTTGLTAPIEARLSSQAYTNMAYPWSNQRTV